MLHVAVLSWRAPGDPDAGGSELHAREILSRWVAGGVDVTVFARRAPEPGPTESDLPFRVVATGGTYGVFGAAPVAVLRRRRHFDAVVEILNGVPFWSPLWWRGPRVVWLHHLHTDMWSQSLPRPLSDIGRWNERTLVPKLYSGSTVVTLATTGRTELEHAGFGHVEVVTPGIAPRYQPAPPAPRPQRGPRLIAVGRLVPVKRWPELIRAVVPLARRFEDLRLELVGDGPLRSELEQWKRAHDADWLTLHGRVSDDDLVSLYRSADLVVSASSAEGWGMTITEAARCGVPAVATDVTGHRAAILDGETGVLVPDPADLTTAIEALLLDEEWRRRLAIAAADRARTMTWDDAAARHLELLGRAVESTSGVRFGR